MSKNHSIYPKARTEGIISTKVGDETVVYDTEKNIASCLNELTTAVWVACDGNTDISSILDTVINAKYKDTTEQIVLMAIEELNQAGLLEAALESNEKNKGNLGRREMLRLLGTRAAKALPLVSTITVQPALAAFSLPCQGSNCPRYCTPPANQQCWSSTRGCYCTDNANKCFRSGGIVC